MKLRRLFRRAAWDRERTREIEAHIAHMADDLRARGVAPEEAERRARARFGNVTAVREEIYEMNSLPWFETLVRDARYALRLLGRSPGFAATAILTLGIAIGANAAVFSLVDAVLLRPLPYPKPEQLANIQYRQISARGTFEGIAIDGRMWESVREHVKSADVAVYSDWRAGVNLAAGSSAVNVDQQRVSAGYFRVLGVAPALGREFTPDEDIAGGPNAVVLSHGLWKTAFGGDPGVIERTVLLRGESHRIVGVMPEGFGGSGAPDVWTPLRPSRTGQGGGTNFGTIVRIHDGASKESVEAEVMAAYRALGDAPQEGVTSSFGLVPLHETVSSGSRDALLTMWGAVALVLLIACVNLAGLLLARGRTRTREIATRMALGSGRRAVIRQLVVESVTLSVIGGALGLVVGYLLLNGLQALAADQYAQWQDVSLDLRAVAATAVVSLTAAVLFGTIPAWYASRLDVQSGLREGDTRGASAASGGWTRRLLVVGEVALGVVLLAGAGLLTRTFLALHRLEPGFDLDGVVTATASLEDKRYQTAEQVQRLFDDTVRRMREIPGVESAAISMGLPYQRILNLGFRPLDGEQAADRNRNFITNVTYVTPDYFRVLRMPLKKGREISASDRMDAPGIALVNEAFEKRYYPEGVLGRRIRMAGAEREVVGIVGDVQHRNPGWGTGGPIRTTPIVYLPAAQTPSATLNLVHQWFGPTWVVRTSSAVSGIEQQIRAAVSAADPQLPLASVRGMGDVRSSATASQRFMMVLAALLGGASMLLAAIGIHGLIASSITERTREIGIRLALGSSAGQAVRTLAWPGVAMTLIGIGAGLLLARALTRYIQTLLWGVQPTDPATFIGVAALLLLVAIVASVLPALRILRLDPARTLRM